MSAEANLAGFYPPMKNQIWDGLKWMPIPVHTVSGKEDYLLRQSKYCPRYDYELQKLLTSAPFERINKENAKLYAYLSENAGDEISSLKDVEHLYDILYIEVYILDLLIYMIISLFYLLIYKKIPIYDRMRKKFDVLLFRIYTTKPCRNGRNRYFQRN